MNIMPRHVCVCIVGAGVAGLGAAHRLIQAGVDDILILEAQDRVGGRVHTVRHGSDIIELGAHWIHGEEGNVVYEWAAEQGLVPDEASTIQTASWCTHGCQETVNTSPQCAKVSQHSGEWVHTCARPAVRVKWDSGYGNTMFIRQNGEVVPAEAVDGFLMAVANITESSKEDLKTYPHSVGDYYHEKFRLVNKWGIVGDEMLEWESLFQNCLSASDSWFDLSGVGLAAYKECPGNPTVNWKEDGYQNLINHLQEKLPPSCLMLKSPVEGIQWGGSEGCRITLEAGHVLTASHVIFTASLGVLKAKASTLFSPALPAKKMRAIEGLGFGVVDKIFLQFAHQWWADDCDGFSMLPSLQDMPEKITKENWECGLVGFYAVYKQPNMLCAWMYGPTATVVEQTSENEVMQRCVAMLRRLLAPQLTVPDAIWCRQSTWRANPWTRGSYSFHSMKSEELAVQASDLATPLLDSKNTPVVCFAGEATHDCFYSTVHGALESGRREADRLTEHFKSPQVCGSVKARGKYEVVVVGAGAAGVGAARELTHHGIKSVIILEGSDRVGGRINTVKTPGDGVVELGAQWVHGQEGNAVYRFAATRGLLHTHLSQDGKGSFFTEDGKAINEDIIQQVSEVLSEADEECINYFHDRKRGGLECLSVGEVFRRKFFEYLEGCTGDSPEIRALKEALFYWHLRWQRIDNACDSLHQLSAKCWGQYIYCEGNDNMNPKTGFVSILRALLAETSADLKLDSEVTCIEYSQEVTRKGGACEYVQPDGTTYPVIVKCSNGSEYEAQHVIVTTSIGYLKAHPDLFSPSLPNRLWQSVSSRGYGTLDKIFLEYDAAWWWKDCEGIQLVWTKHIPDFERHAPHTKCIDGSYEKMSEYWVRAISGFDPVFNQHAMLCGWLCGPEAHYMETLTDHQVGQECTHLLRHFLPHINIPYPKKVYRSRWASDKFFHGSYSYHGVGCACCSDPGSADLNTPVTAVSTDGSQVPVVVLAGEANSKKFYSTVHGALQSGMQQASHYIHTREKLHGNLKSKI